MSKDNQVIRSCKISKIRWNQIPPQLDGIKANTPNRQMGETDPGHNKVDCLLKKELNTAEKYKDNVLMLISCKIIRKEIHCL